MSISQAYDDNDATGLAALVAAGEVTPGDLLDEALRRAESLNPKHTALTLRRPQRAREAIAVGLPKGPFHGVPFLLKDLGAEAVGFPSNSGSRLTEAQEAPGDSTFVARCREAGLAIFGRTTSPEFGVGPVTEAAVYGGPTRNPWDLSRSSGGSSGGAGAAVAAGILPAAHASDGAGSIRIPASCCGLVGFKPTRARVPAGPFVGEGWAGLATSGFLTRTVRDTAALLDAVMGPEIGAPYAAPPLARPLAEAAGTDPGRLRVRVLTGTLTGDPIHPDCKAAVERAARLLEELGHEVEETGPPPADMTGCMAAIARILACATAARVRAEVAARGRPLEPDEVEPVALGAMALAERIDGAEAGSLTAVVHAYGRAMEVWMQGFDVLLTATLAEPPAKVGRFAHKTEDFLDYRLGPDGVLAYSPFTAAFNATGQPAVSLPLGESAGGLPIGVHLASGFGRDDLLTSLSAQLERAAPWRTRRPQVRAGA